MVNVMIGAAQKAGIGLRRAFSEIEKLQVSKKGPGDYVTEADRRSEKVIFDELKSARPNYGFLMEETGSVNGKDNSTYNIGSNNAESASI